MALATKCPHCNTIFRVAADQLKLRGGIVRCGACQQVFDGNAALVEPAAKPTPVMPEVAVAARPAPPAAPAVSEHAHGAQFGVESDSAAGQATGAEPPVASPAVAAPSAGELPDQAPFPAGLAEEAEQSDAEARPEPSAPAVWRTGHAQANTADTIAPPADAAPSADAETPGDAPSGADAALPADAEAPGEALLRTDSSLAGDAETPGDALSFPGTSATDAADEGPAAAEADAQTGEASADAVEPTAADDDRPDGRIEPTLDTPQEHVVAAALDDAHHFEDLPSGAPTDAGTLATDADGNHVAEPSLADEPWSASGTIADESAPDDEPWSMTEPERDETALHAVAAVNTDAPDDGESVPDDEVPAEESPTSRRERALKRAQARRDARSAARPTPDATAGNAPAGAEEPVTAGDGVDEAARAAARMRALAGVDDAGEADLDHSDLSFVKRVERSQKYGKAVRVAMATGIPLLLAGLVLQAATTFRDTLAANYPQLKPALSAICQPLGCQIALPAQLDALSIESGELASLAENTFSYSTVLRNRSKTPQAWPHIELRLNDNADKPVLRRVFAPREYLPSPAEADKGFGPRSEQSIKLYFELKALKASGYHISIFYP